MFDPSSINPSSIFGFVAPCFGKSGNIRLKQCDEDAFGPIKLRTSFDSTATDVLLRENAPTVVSAAPTSDCFRKCRRCIEDRQTVAFTGFYGIGSRKFSKKSGKFSFHRQGLHNNASEPNDADCSIQSEQSRSFTNATVFALDRLQTNCDDYGQRKAACVRKHAR